jgi:hypothetical protein
MEPRYATPRELVEALQRRADGARADLWQRLGEPVERLIDELVARHQLDADRGKLSRHALHLAETYLRTRSARPFATMTWIAFRGAVLLQLAKLVFQPYGGPAGPAAGPQPLPESPSYQCQTIFLPHERIGNHWFGGDWFAGAHADDGSLWVIVADITGHGYHAYLLASSLPGVWQQCWQNTPPATRQPADLLAAMHHLLKDCLPEGVYVECTLARLGPEGDVTVVPAGGTRLVLRRGGAGRTDLLKLRGTWLGLGAPSRGDQHTWQLDAGDELLLGTDGMFDQLLDHAGDEVFERLEGCANGRGLFDAVPQLLSETLRETPPKDDITMVLLRRRAPVEESAATLPFPGCSVRNGAGDVSV